VTNLAVAIIFQKITAVSDSFLAGNVGMPRSVTNEVRFYTELTSNISGYPFLI